MANEGFVMPLSGEEIINDVLLHVERKLRTDCNLRDTDAYSGGYDGEINIKLNLHGMDVARAEVSVQMGRPIDDPEAHVLEEKIEIEHDKDLDAVRERSEQEIPIQTLDGTGKHEIKGRKFARRHAVGSAIEE